MATKTTTRKTTAKKTPAKKTPAKKTSAKVTSAKKDVKVAVTKLDNAQDKIVDAVEDIVSAGIDKAQKIAKQAWFASLGAYGRSYEELKTRYAEVGEELQARYSKFTKEGQNVVKDLVSRGEQVQDQAEELLKDRRTAIEEQIEVAKSRLVSVVDVPARLQDVSNTLESLSKELQKKSA